MLLINWLTKVTNDPIVQGAGAVNVVGVGSNENCRNRVPCLDAIGRRLSFTFSTPIFMANHWPDHARLYSTDADLGQGLSLGNAGPLRSGR